MQAIAINQFVEQYGELRECTVPLPQPKQNEALVQIAYSGLNYVDLLYCRGKHQNNRRHVKPPFILGLEFAGTIVACPGGPFQPGDRVFGGAGSGAFAEYIAVKVEGLKKVPDQWTLKDAAGIAATAPVSYGALAKIAKVKAADVVLIHAAAGGLGCMAVQIAKAFGAKVIGTVGSEEKAAVVKKLGADHVINYNRADWENDVLEITRGVGVDVTFDSVGLIEKSIRCSKYGACILIVGFAGREGNLEKIAANRILLKSIQLLGYRYGEHGRQTPEHHSEIWEDLAKLLDNGMIKPVIYKESYHGLEAVPRAMADMAARKVWGKAVICVDRKTKQSRM